MQIQNNARNASVNAVTPLWEGGTIVFKTGSPPASGTGTPIVTVNIDANAFPSASGGQSIAPQAGFSAGTAIATGTVAQYEVFTSAATGSVSVCFGSVGLSSSGADFIFTDTSFNSGDILQITQVTYTQPAS